MSDLKPKGWFSRRHQDNSAHLERQREFQNTRSKEARKERALKRQAARQERTNREQYRLIEERPGHSAREWERLGGVNVSRQAARDISISLSTIEAD